jgi:peptidylprolyl isomerase
MLRVLFTSLAFGAAALAAACGPRIPVPSDVAGPPPDATTTPSGLATKVLQAGHGTRHPGPRDRVKVHYSGWTTDGAMFDSSVARGEPITFGLDQVIPGWTEGVQLMVEGEKRRLWIPERLAYQGAPGAPAGMLVFDVELIAIGS